MSPEKAYAAVITVDFMKADVMWTIFEEEEGKPDPLLQAQQFRRGVKDDWPGYEHHLIANERAGELQARRLLGPLYDEVTP